MTTIVATVPVTVRNASYEVLGKTTLKRAVALVMSGRAVIEEEDPERILAWENGLMAFPLVIRMLEMLHVPFRVAPAHFSKGGVLERDHKRCGYCRKPALTIDHIFPRSRGGKDSWENCIAACHSCNGRKANRTPEEADMPLLFQPEVPMRVYLTGGKRRKKQH